MLKDARAPWWGRSRRVVMLVVVGLSLLLGGMGRAEVAPVHAAPRVQADQPVVIYFFWGDGCPHCSAEKPFLAELQQRYPSVKVHSYEVWNDRVNQLFFRLMGEAYGFEPSAVPTTLIGRNHWVGFADTLAAEMEAAVQFCVANGCPDAGAGVLPGIPTATPVAPPTAGAAVASTAAEAPAAALAAAAPEFEQAALLQMPWLGTIDLRAQSLALSTALIALVDGFNPCSLWVLSILLALTLHTGSRKKVLIVGLVFITVTAFIYMLFIAGLFTVFRFVSFLGWIQALIALIAIFFAAVNIKDYFWYKQGLSFTIADSRKPGIYQGMRRIIAAGDSLWGMIAATVLLAVGVSIVEFSCTAGFPMLWTNLLISQEATTWTFVALLLVYMLIYQLDELGIFLVSVVTLKSKKLEESQGRLLKLIGGMLMLALAGVMLIDPTWMNNLATSLYVFGAALVAAGLVVALDRWLLPRLGIRIGDGGAPPVAPAHAQAGKRTTQGASKPGKGKRR